MSRVEDIDRYLRAYFAAQRVSPAQPEAPAIHPFVTISREAGIGGHVLADTIVDVFSREHDQELFSGWRVFDRTICEMVAQDPRYRRSLDSLLEEEYRSKANDFFHQMVRSTVNQKLVMNRVFLAVRTVAGMGKAVIVGRAGSHVTRDMPQGVALRVVAPDDHRTRRIMETQGLDERDARALVRKRDSDRARLLKAHFGADIDDPTGYDAVFNVERMAIAEIAHAAAAMVRSRAAKA